MDRNMILIADDQEINREILKAMFEEQYGILQAADGFEAIERIKKHHRQIALIFLDMLMPGKPGMEVLAFMTGRGYTDVIPVIMITEDSTDDMNEKAYEYGVADIIYKPFASKVVMRRAMNMIELYAHRADIEQKLKMRTRQLVESQ